MQKEMLNINGNLINEVEIKVIKGKDGVYGEKAEFTKEFEKGDFIHVFGYFKEVKKEDKSYRNFIVKHLNKADKTVNEEEE